MSQIQSSPRGLQELLGLKNFGRNPSELADIVTPTIDIAQLYQADRLSVLRENDTTFQSNPDRSINLQIPSGEIWLVKEMFVSCGPLVTDSTYEFRAFIEPNQNQGPLSLNQDAYLLDNWNFTTDTSPNLLRTSTRRYILNGWFPSGYSFFFEENSSTALGVQNVRAAVGVLAIPLKA